MKPLLSRKDLATLTQMHVDTIAKHERKLGLDKCKVVLSQRLILYRADAALRCIGLSNQAEKPNIAH